MKPVLFIDFHGTLSNDYFWKSLSREVRQEITHVLFSEPSLITREWMKGTYTSEDINKIMAEHLGLQYEELWHTFVNDCKSIQVIPEALPLMDELRKKYYTVLLTDNMDCFSRFVVPSLGLARHVDYIANSWDEKILKNEHNGEAFLRHVYRNNSSISDSILIDDSKSVCTLFENLGGTSYLVTRERPLTYWLTHLK
jgi:FMN phosphatase YigB (HAD superfamily)